jgi:HlyD family secretion protein
VKSINGGKDSVAKYSRVLIAALVTGLLVSACSGPDPAVVGTSRTATVSRQPIEVRVSGTGQIEALAQAALGFPVQGIVGQVNVEVGDQVGPGDILMSLDLASLDPSLLSAEADLIQAELSLEELTDENNWLADLAEARKALAQAQEALEDAEYLRRVRQQGYRASEGTIDAAEARLLLAQNSYDRAKGAYDRLSGRPSDDEARAIALTNLEAARQSRDSALRTVNWYKGSPSDVEQAQLEADVALAEANLAKAQELVEVLEQGPDPVQLALAEARLRAARARYQQSHLTAPFEGTILSVTYAVGDSVGPGQVAVQVADLTSMHVETVVDELDIASVELGQPVEVTLDALPDITLQGMVAEIALAPSAVGTAAEYPLVVELIDVDPRARIGMTVALEILVKRKENALVVPNWALRFDSEANQIYVTIETAGGVERRQVELGLRNESESEIVSGLEPGQVVTIAVTPEAPSFAGPFGGGG